MFRSRWEVTRGKSFTRGAGLISLDREGSLFDIPKSGLPAFNLLRSIFAGPAPLDSSQGGTDWGGRHRPGLLRPH